MLPKYRNFDTPWFGVTIGWPCVNRPLIWYSPVLGSWTFAWGRLVLFFRRYKKK